MNTQVYDLPQGQWQANKDGTLISTLLGSCVAICLFDLAVQAGGMNHYLLPSPAPGENPLPKDRGRYGCFAIDLLIADLEKLGAAAHRLQAKIFGGAQMYPFQSKDQTLLVGEQNVHFAQDYLAKLRIPLVAADVGKNHARKIFFSPHTGAVKLFRHPEQAAE